ncbi:hypothetical protein [Solirubrobacter soli]|uniref:hypothetical protein n=1 Tax=Solirubrobacter soli TaxID=363832 RepID=UPI0012FB6CB2|nr:hypothetical protein [Solirubrobacter soli]
MPMTAAAAAAQLPLSADASQAAVAGVPTFPPPSPDGRPPPGFNGAAEVVAQYLPYADLANFMAVSKATRGGVDKAIQSRFVVSGGLSPKLAKQTPQVAHALASGAPDRRLLDEPSAPNWDPPKRGSPPSDEQKTLDAALGEVPDVLTAIRWRELRHKKPASLAQLGDQVRRHAVATALLRAAPPQSTGRDLSPPSAQMKERMAAVGKHWQGLYEARRGARVPDAGSGWQTKNVTDGAAEDATAKRVGEKLNGQGHNFTVVRPPEDSQEPPQPYSNRILERKELEEAQKVTGPITPVLTTADERRNWSQAFGNSRPSADIRLHSEMQPTLTQQPWEMRYAGNNYYSCAQCTAAYHALDRTNLNRGSHGAKAPSIIPPRIRTNSVYLSHYLGAEQLDPLLTQSALLTRSPTAAPASQPSPPPPAIGSRPQLSPHQVAARHARDLVRLMERLEREDSSFYKTAGLEGDQYPTKTYG